MTKSGSSTSIVNRLTNEKRFCWYEFRMSYIVSLGAQPNLQDIYAQILVGQGMIFVEVRMRDV